MVVFSQQQPDEHNTAARSIAEVTRAALLQGLRIVHIPIDFEEAPAEDALWFMPHVDDVGIFIGYIPHGEYYEQLDTAAKAKGVRLLNTPEQSRLVTEFDRYYPIIESFTIPSSIVRKEEDIATAAKLGFPLFVKGLVKSRKEDGIKACFADNLGELTALCKVCFAREYTARNVAVVRKAVKFKHTQKSAKGFPIGREYRVILLNEEILGLGYYWDVDDPLAELLKEEEMAVISLARKVARAVNVPLLCVDIGQLENGQWIVVEIGDPQFSGMTHVNRLAFWSKLSSLV